MLKPKWLHFIGNTLIFISLVILLFTFSQVGTKEVEYQVRQSFNVPYQEKDLTPPNTDFAIVIPKIGAVAPVIDNVDPFNPKSYLPALFKGVAHAKGTAYPGQFGNTYIFAHSTDSFYNVGRYNAVFYLIGQNFHAIWGAVKTFNLVIFAAFSVTVIAIFWYKLKKRKRIEPSDKTP